MTRVADILFAALAAEGLTQAFLVTGGGAMFLNDALRRESRITWTCHHHEQAAAMAAEGYARISGRPAIVSVTSGPGGINALNGVFGAWTDSVPMVVVSGQVKRETCVTSYPGLRLRQLGDQEADIVRLVESITKYAVRVTDPSDIEYEARRAVALAVAGRPGPVWLDVPVDVQGVDMAPGDLRRYDPSEDAVILDRERLIRDVGAVLEHLGHAQRPVIMAGSGVRIAGAADALLRVVRLLGVPVTTAWCHDIVASDDPHWCGRPGTIGDRAGNFTVQNADLLLVVGSRLNIRQVSYNWASFAPQATIVQVDIDEAELEKPTVRPDLGVVADAREFLEELDAQAREKEWPPGRWGDWLAWCRERVLRYPVVQPHQRRESPPINPYHFMETLFALLGGDDVVVSGNGAACVMAFQAGRLRQGQRMFSNSGSASMGYDLPASLGAAVALHEKYSSPSASRRPPHVVCLAGDGSLQMNIQELQTLATHRWPVKVFVLDNGGYLSIRTTQVNFFDGLIGESTVSGVGFPDWVAVGEGYGVESVRLDQPRTMREEIASVLASTGPSLVHVVLDPEQGFEPRVRSRRHPDGTIESPALDDLFPFLSPEELAENRLPVDQLGA